MVLDTLRNILDFPKQRRKQSYPLLKMEWYGGGFSLAGKPLDIRQRVTVGDTGSAK